MSKPVRAFAGIIHTASQALDAAQFQREIGRCGLSGAEQIKSFTTAAELRALFRLAKGCDSGGAILEIGSYLGKATCYLAAGSAGANADIYCVDTWNNETMPDGTRDTYAEFQKNVRPVNGRIHCIRKSSEQLLATDVRLPISMAFIDGDHSYEAVRRDWAIVEPMMAANGVVAFHDSRYYAGVSKVIGEVLVAGQWSLAGVEHNLTWIRPANWSPALGA